MTVQLYKTIYGNAINKPCVRSETLDAWCLFMISTCTLDDITLFSKQWVTRVGDSADVFSTHIQPWTECCRSPVLSARETKAVPSDASTSGLPLFSSANRDSHFLELDVSVLTNCILSSSSANTHTIFNILRHIVTACWWICNTDLLNWCHCK